MPTSVMLCSCGGTLEKVIDFNALEDSVRGLGVAHVGKHAALCVGKGLQMLEEHIKTVKPSSIVIVGGSKRTCLPAIEHVLKITKLDSHCVDTVNLREHCAWVHSDDREKATAKAKKMLRAALAKAEELQPIERRVFKMKDSVLVVGGGIAGIQAALDLAHQGIETILLEKTPTIGGIMALLVKTFPTDDCAICIEGPKMADVMAHPDIQTITYADIVDVKKYPDGFKVKILKKPRYIDTSKCTGCGVCTEKCPVKIPNEWSGGLGTRKAVYLPFPQALPRKYTIDSENCLYIIRNVCRVCEKFCEAKAVDFDQKSEEIEIEIGSIILATGFDDFDPKLIPKYGYGKYSNIVTQRQLARILDPEGPTQGKLVRLSDGKKPKRITMLQCVGSRDPETNPYCSRYCCMAAMKNATLIKIEQDPEAEINIIYKDIRAAGKGFEEYFVRAQERFGVKFTKGEVVQIRAKPETGELIVEYTDPAGKIQQITSDYVVLSAGAVPAESSKELVKLMGVKTDDYGFIEEVDEKVSSVETNVPGIYVCGCAQGPKDIPESVAQASAAAGMAALHVRKTLEKDLPLPYANDELCGRCMACAKACPYDAITVDMEKGPQFDDIACQSCGLCVSSCPAGAIEMPNSGYAVLSKQIEAALSANPSKVSPTVLCICCDECGYTLLDTVGFRGGKYPANIIPVYVPCLSSVSSGHILKALTEGADGVLLVGCQDERCHFVKGVKRAKWMLSMLGSMLESFGIEPNRMRVVDACASMVEDFVEAANGFVASLRGRN